MGADGAARLAAVSAQFAAGGVDAVVQNDLEEFRREPAHRFRLYRSPAREPVEVLGAVPLAAAVERFLRTA